MGDLSHSQERHSSFHSRTDTADLCCAQLGCIFKPTMVYFHLGNINDSALAANLCFLFTSLFNDTQS